MIASLDGVEIAISYSLSIDLKSLACGRGQDTRAFRKISRDKLLKMPPTRT